MVGRQAIGIDTFDRSTRVRHPDPVRFSACFCDSVQDEGRRESEGECEEKYMEGTGLGRRGNRGEHSRETMRGRLATVISENVS